MVTQKKFEKAINSMIEQGLAMDTVIVKQNGSTFKHVFENGTGVKNIRSISKTVTSLCMGKAIEDGFLSEGIEKSVYSFFADRKITDDKNLHYLQRLKIKHLITLTIGHEERSMNSNQMAELRGQDLIDFILNFPIKHEPGSFFLYTNPPAYLSSYVIQEATGMKLHDYAKKSFFAPMGIFGTEWKESEQGYNMGCTGLEISADDLLKIGELLLNRGCYNGNQLINRQWVDNMTKTQVLTPSMYDEKRVLPKYAYGYNLWICQNGNYYCDGTDGQYLIVVPAAGMVIVTMGFQSNMKPITECLKEIINDEG